MTELRGFFGNQNKRKGAELEKERMEEVAKRCGKNGAGVCAGPRAGRVGHLKPGNQGQAGLGAESCCSKSEREAVFCGNKRQGADPGPRGRVRKRRGGRKPSGDGRHEGIKVHGHWTIEVRNTVFPAQSNPLQEH